MNVLLLPAIALAGMLTLWWGRGRDPDPRSVDVRYGPPEGLGPAECGVLLDTRVRLRHVTATLLDLAARGHLVVEEVEPPADEDLERDFRFHRLSDSATWEELARHERILLHLFFSPRAVWPPDPGPVERALRAELGARDGRESVRVSDLGQPFRLTQGMEAFFAPLVARGYFRRLPGRTRLRYLAAAGLLMALGLGGASTPVGYGSVVLAAAIVAGVGWHMPARTREGRRAAEHVAGYREYLARTEADRLERAEAAPADVDRTLAFGAALGLGSAWTKALDPLYGDQIETVEEAEEEVYRRAAVSVIRDLMRPAGRENAVTGSPREPGRG